MKSFLLEKVELIWKLNVAMLGLDLKVYRIE